jgi:hypothetical protein
MRKLSWLLTVLLVATVINYPNPFNPLGGEAVSFECTSDTSAEAFLYVYDLGARLILRREFNLVSGAPNYLGWDGYSDYNELAANGIYLYQVITKTNERVAKGKIWVINQ